jgi:hypothetical protein
VHSLLTIAPSYNLQPVLSTTAALSCHLHSTQPSQARQRLLLTAPAAHRLTPQAQHVSSKDHAHRPCRCAATCSRLSASDSHALGPPAVPVAAASWALHMFHTAHYWAIGGKVHPARLHSSCSTANCSAPHLRHTPQQHPIRAAQPSCHPPAMPLPIDHLPGIAATPLQPWLGSHERGSNSMLAPAARNATCQLATLRSLLPDAAPLPAPVACTLSEAFAPAAWGCKPLQQRFQSALPASSPAQHYSALRGTVSV